MKNKVRITCTSCLHSEIEKKHKSDPKGTRLIVTESCPNCNEESSGNIRYYDSTGDEIKTDLNHEI